MRFPRFISATDSPFRWWVAGSVWVLSLAVGFGLLIRYKETPGAASRPGFEWPDASHVRRVPGKSTLIMFAHPQCPCTRASLVELERLMARVPEQVTTTVLFSRPKVHPSGWEDTDLWSKAQRIPGVSVRWDDEGREAALFTARTSGQMVAYDPDGRLLFKGGVTGSRGHAGDNAGSARLLAAIRSGVADSNVNAVFGCALERPTRGGSAR